MKGSKYFYKKNEGKITNFKSHKKRNEQVKNLL
jgi:hypothetical protein